MSIDPDRSRVVGEVLPLDYRGISQFFEARGKDASKSGLTATMYQDADLATRRDAAEKALIAPLLAIRPDDRVLDLGCGSGRWAEVIAPSVASYLGIDFSEPLLEVARARIPGARFQKMNLAEFDDEKLASPPPFTVVICSGILAYINDPDVVSLFARLSRITADSCRFYLREPMAKDARLTLDRHWSQELQTHYSAVYRTKADYLKLLAGMEGFQVQAGGEPFPHELQNRSETEQRYIFLTRASVKD